MKTILELIESWQPCYRYKQYVAVGYLRADMTIDDILYSKDIINMDKEWFFDGLFKEGIFDIIVYAKTILVFNTETKQAHRYTYADFLAMVDEYLEYANIDAAI